MDDDETAGPPEWFGWAWAAETDQVMREAQTEALLDHLDETEVAVMFAYLAEPEHGFGFDAERYTAHQIAEMFRHGKVEYPSWAHHGEQWLDEHFPGAWTDPILGERLTEEDLEAMGEAEARSDDRYWWHEATSGLIYGLLTPSARKEQP